VSANLISGLAPRIDDLVAEESLAKRIQLGRELRLWIASELSPLDAGIAQAKAAAAAAAPENPFRTRGRRRLL